MFYKLHRLYIGSWVALVVGAMVWLYPRTGVSESLLDWYGVWQNTRGAQAKPVEEVDGKVTRVLDGSSFTLQSATGPPYIIGLLGAVPPIQRTNSPKAQLEFAERSKAQLSELILSNQVQVMVTGLGPLRRGLGIVHLGDTNVNAAMIQAGWLELKREFIKGLPLREQYELLRADRKTRRAQRAATN